jgi:PhnB protein
MPVRPIPEGYRSVTPYLTLDNAAAALDFYKRAFGAQETVRMSGPPGKISHAELKIGDSMIMVSDEFPQASTRSPKSLGGSTVGVFLYVPDVDATFKQAVNAGAKSVMEPTNMFWGDRFSTLTDPFGHVWSLATHVEDVAPAEMERRSKEWMAQMAQQQHKSSAA